MDDSAAPSERPTRGRRVLLGLGAIGLAICALVIIALIAVHTPPARRYITEQVVALLAREQIEFSTDELSFNALNASINLRNIRIRSTTWPDAPVFATLGRVRIDLSLLDLLRGRYVVQSGTVDDANVHYFVDEQGRDNLPRPPRDPDQPGEPLDYLVSELSIAGANVRYENLAQQIDARLPVSSIEVSGDRLTNRHDLRLRAAGGSLQIQERQAAIDRLTGEVDLGEDDVSIGRLEVETEGSTARVTGTIRQFEAPVADLAVTSAIDAMRAAALADIDEPVSGTVTIDARAQGPLTRPAVVATISGESLRFRDLRDIRLDAAAAYDVETRSADVSSLQLRAPWGGVTGSGRVALDGSGQSRVQATIDRLDVAAIMRALRLPYVAATRVDGRLQADWPGFDVLRARGTADVTLRPTTSEMATSAMPVSGRLMARGLGNRIDAQLDGISVPGAEIDGRITVTSDRGLRGDLAVHSDDVGRLASSVEAFTGRPAGSLLPTPVSGALDATARVGGSLSDPTAATIVNAPALRVGTAEGIALNADASYAQNAIAIARADMTWQDARAHLDGRIGLRSGQPIQLSFSADALQIQALLQAMNQADVPASGVLTARGTVGGTLQRPTATVTAEGLNLVAYEEPIGSLNANVNLDGSQVTLSELVVDKPQPDQAGRLTARGTYNLDSRTYTFDLRSQGVKLVGLLLPDGKRIRGDVQQLAARGEGSVSSPQGTFELDIDGLEIVNAPAPTPEQESSGTIPLGRVVINAVARNKEATVMASAENFNLDADAVIGLARPWPANVKVQVNDLDLATLPLQIEPRTDAWMGGLQGQLRATVDASGNLAEPEKGKATVALEALDGSWHGRPFAVTSPSPIEYADERLIVEQLQVAASDTSLTVSGDLPLTEQAAPGEIDLELKGSLATLTQYAPPDTNLAGDGTIALTGSLRGTLTRIEPDLLLTIDRGLILSRRLEPGFSNIVLRARIANGEADIEQLDAHWGTATLRASGRVPLGLLPELPVEIPEMSGPARLEAAITGLDPSSIPGAPAQLSGTISAEAQVAAAAADLAAIDGQVTFQELDVAFSGLELAQQQPSAITIDSGTATVERLNLAGSAGELQAAGRIELVGERALDVNVDGNLNVAAVSLLTDHIRTEGDASLQVVARGTMSEPELAGSVELTNVIAVSDEPNIAAENINARLNLEGRRIVLGQLEADVNGGTLTGSGSVTLGEGLISDVDLQIAATDIAFDAPLDLRSISDSTIRVTRDDGDIVVSGQVTIDEAGLTGDVNFDTGLLAAINARRTLDLTEGRNPLLERIRFDVDVNTATPVLVDNNIARAEIETDLTVVGTLYETGLLGRLILLEGSEIRLNERRYQAERGIIQFADERRIFPNLDLRLNTTAGAYDITVAVNGTPGDTETTLTSSPALPEPDIMAMLVTGRTLDQMRGEEYEVAREQVLSYLAGRVGSTIGSGLQQATGFSEVRLEPTLIANEADPSARLTVGQEITDDLKLVYSTNLTDSNDQIWVAEYDVTRRFQTRGVRQDDDSYRFDFRHDVRFGGQPEPRRLPRTQATVADVGVMVAAGVSEPAVREAFGVEAGDAYDFFEVRNGVDRIEESLMDQGYLQSRVKLERRVEGDQAYLMLDVTTGPRVEVRYTGAAPPADVQGEIRTQWHRGVFDKQRGDDGADAVREWLMSDNHLQAMVSYRIEDIAEDQRRVTFEIEPGPRSERVVLAFEGAAAIDPDELDAIVEQQRLERQLFTDPFVVTELLERYYREQGFLSAEIEQPRYEYDNAIARVVVAVSEGPRFSVRRVAVDGNTVHPTDTLMSQLPVVPGAAYTPLAAENALEKIRDLYWDQGYNDVRSEYDLVIDRARGEVDVSFTIAEGRQSVIAGVTIEGNHRVSDRLVHEQIQLAPEQPLDLAALARSRRNLYETGAFSVVDITRQEIDTNADPGAGPEDRDRVQGLSPADGTKPVEIQVQVREVQPFQLRYGASYDTERGIGGILDISNHNSLGGARVIGLSARYDRQLREGRLYINNPALNYLPKTTGNIYFREEQNPLTELTNPFDTTRRGVSVQQEHQLRDAYVLTYGYRWERAHTLIPTDAGVLDEMLSVSPVTSTLTREARDEILDATRGSFLSQAFSYSPSWLGSDQAFIKYFGQYFRYFPLQSPRRKPFTNEIIRPRLVYAVGVRLGLGRGMGSTMPRTERFFAGGSQTLRGFAQNAVGPIGLDRIPIGGEAMIVINNELRAPLFGMFDGVVFSDIGNVFGTVRDFSFTDLRQSVGAGLRVRTPWVLLRGDYGVVLDPRPGEGRSRFYFSIGQAF